MRKYLATLAVIGAAAGLVAAPIEAARLSGEERLAKLIEGRSAGAPRNCIATNSHHNLTVIDKTAIVDKQGRKVWVNRTKHPETLDDDDVMRWVLLLHQQPEIQPGGTTADTHDLHDDT